MEIKCDVKDKEKHLACSATNGQTERGTTGGSEDPVGSRYGKSQL